MKYAIGIIYIGFFFLFPCFLFSQGTNNNWYFGKHAGVTFNYGNPVALTNCATSFAEKYCPFSVSDSSGNLLFYAGIYYESENLQGTVYDRSHQIMPNGHYLYTGWDTKQNYLAIQKLDDDSSYFLFAMDEGYTQNYTNPKGLTYSVIDLRLNGGFGDIVPGQKSIQIPGAEQTNYMLSTTRHKNNHDVWIAVRKYVNSNSYLTYLITSSGINTVPVVSSSLFNLVYPYNLFYSSMIRFSPDGTKLIGLYSDSLEYCQFNSLNGTITPLFKIHIYGSQSPNAEFSINGKYLYIFTQENGGSIFQYDATKTDSLQFIQSKTLISTMSMPEVWLQRGPDNKIYVTEISKDSLAVIHNPTIHGIGCNYQRNEVYLGPGNHCNQGLPQFLQTYYVYIHHSNILCAGDTVNYNSTIWPLPDSIHWNFGDPSSGTSNISIIANPNHIFSAAGTYTVELYVRHNDNRTDTTWQTITILPAPQPALGPDQTICTPQTATFDAGACNGCTYQWGNLTTGQPNVGTGQTYTTGTAGTYLVSVTGQNGCTGKDTIQVFTGTPAVVTTSITTGTTTVCSSTPVTFTVSGNPTGTSPSWQWKVNGVNTGTGGQVFTYAPANGDCITCVLTSNALCVTGNPATSNQVCMTVNQLHPVSLTITSTSTHTCAGTSVTFNGFPTNPGNNPVYLWKVNGVISGTNSQIFTYTPANGDCITCLLTSDINCPIGNPALSNTICMTVDQPLPVSVTVTTPQTMVCAGTLVTFSANPTHGGTLPGYQWKVNTVNVSGATSLTYTYVPLNGDVVTCQLTSSDNCVTGNPAISPPVTMTVNQNFVVTNSIAASSNPFCAGSQVTFTATPDHGGLAPGYQWKVNGGNAGTNSPSFTFSPANSDQVSCILNSSASCITGNPALSNIITMTVNTNLPAGVSISTLTNPFCPGTSVTITATPTNGGLTPVYQWKLNGANAGTNLPTFTFNPVAGDSVRCVMTSNLNCVTGNPASSARIILTERAAPNVTFTSCFDTVTILGAQPFSLHGGLPLGGQYSGPGVNTGIFTPSVAGIGLKTITYGYSNVFTCLATKTKTILVQPNPAFTCGNNMTDIRDNKIYPTVQIGSQCWMASNLDFGFQISDLIPQTDNCLIEKYSHSSIVMGNSFYQWDELMRYQTSPGSQGLCPPGWHIPSAAEWNVLLAFLNGPGQAAGPMKDTLIVNGFHSYQDGFLYLENTWAFTTGLDAGAMYWTSTASGVDRAVSRGLNNYNPSVSMYPSLRGNAFSVRCCRD